MVNMGVGEATQNAKVLDPAVNELGQITGQKPVVTKAKKSIAAFKVREGMPIGAMVTLRGDRMYEFFDRLVNVALPRVRDFRGVSTKSFDGRGNYTLGLRDQLIFPEIDYAKVDKLKGMNVTIVTTAGDDDQARALLKPWECRSDAVEQVFRLSWYCSYLEARQGKRCATKITGKTSSIAKDEQEAQVLVTPAQPLQDLRTSARFPAQVRPVPPVLPRAGAARVRFPGFRSRPGKKAQLSVFSMSQ